MSLPLIEVHNLCKVFQDKRIIDNFNYTFYKDVIYLLKGNNGSGKSTLIKLILSLYYPTSGKIIRRYKTFSYVPELLNIKSDIKVETYIHQIIKLLKVNRNKDLENLLAIELNKPLKSLSKGNLKKVLLYIAFVGMPDVIFLDEPLDGLDQHMQEKVIRYINQSSSCYIISSHQKDDFKFSNQKVIVFD